MCIRDSPPSFPSFLPFFLFFHLIFNFVALPLIPPVPSSTCACTSPPPRGMHLNYSEAAGPWVLSGHFQCYMVVSSQTRYWSCLLTHFTLSQDVLPNGCWDSFRSNPTCVGQLSSSRGCRGVELTEIVPSARKPLWTGKAHVLVLHGITLQSSWAEITQGPQLQGGLVSFPPRRCPKRRRNILQTSQTPWVRKDFGTPVCTATGIFPRDGCFESDLIPLLRVLI